MLLGDLLTPLERRNRETEKSSISERTLILDWRNKGISSSFTVIAVAITIHPLVFSTEKDSHGFCCNYLFDFIDTVEETVCSANKQS